MESVFEELFMDTELCAWRHIPCMGSSGESNDKGGLGDPVLPPAPHLCVPSELNAAPCGIGTQSLCTLHDKQVKF